MVEKRLREEQDAAYERSLAADKAKEELRKRVTSQTSQPDIVEEFVKTHAAPMPKRRISNALGPEPKDGIKFSFQLSSGTRLFRQFSPSEPCSHLYDFVAQSYDKPFSLRTLAPSSIIPDSSEAISSVLKGGQRLIVEESKE
jgi:UBX domain-containing protein